ncbi:MAG: Holliday junction resolvase RuvX [Acidiferrobacteraceae bacterium]|jgi:putative Holliday junction resolvase
MGGRNLLGFDYGEKTIGVAVGNTGTGQAHPLTEIGRVRGQPDWDAIAGLVQEWNPVALVVGLPLKMDGSDNPVTGAARKFGNRLHERYNLPIYMVDERLTTREARSDLIDAGVPVRRHKPVLDRLAARSILQTFLSEHSESDLERAD